MRDQKFNLPLTLITALLVILIAVLAGSTLTLLRRLHRRSAHTAAAETVIQQGEAMVSRLAAQPAVSRLNPGETDWREFSRLIRNLHAIEQGLQYVSVSRNDVVVFHEQTTRLLDGAATPLPTPATTNAAVKMHRQVVNMGNESLPVVVFTMNSKRADNENISVSVALRKDTVNREEAAAANAIASMFRLTLLTVLISFLVCAVLVVWMMRREVKREAWRREQEHLSFSGMLANGIVHDFRNPMSSMRLDAQMLQREIQKDPDFNPARIQDLAERIRRTLDRMDKVFKEFLYVSRPDSDQPTDMDLTACIRACLEMLAPRFEKASIQCRFTPPPHTIHITAYETSLRRALINVLTNAEQFSPPGGTVTVSLATTDHHAIIDITDQGPGIPANRRKAVFDMFVTNRPGGTGLGLFLAKAAVERSRGTIEITNSPDSNRGTCIRITLPLTTGTNTA